MTTDESVKEWRSALRNSFWALVTSAIVLTGGIIVRGPEELFSEPEQIERERLAPIFHRENAALVLGRQIREASRRQESRVGSLAVGRGCEVWPRRLIERQMSAALRDSLDLARSSLLFGEERRDAVNAALTAIAVERSHYRDALKMHGSRRDRDRQHGELLAVASSNEQLGQALMDASVSLLNQYKEESRNYDKKAKTAILLAFGTPIVFAVSSLVVLVVWLYTRRNRAPGGSGTAPAAGTP